MTLVKRLRENMFVVVGIVVVVHSRGRALELILFSSQGARAGADIVWWR
jgi:hypothetical protein